MNRKEADDKKLDVLTVSEIAESAVDEYRFSQHLTTTVRPTGADVIFRTKAAIMRTVLPTKNIIIDDSRDLSYRNMPGMAWLTQKMWRRGRRMTVALGGWVGIRRNFAGSVNMGNSSVFIHLQSRSSAGPGRLSQ